MLNKPEIKYPLIYGFSASIFCYFTLILLSNILKINPLGGKKEVAFLFIILAMILAVWQARKAFGGAIEFGKAFGICFFTNLIASILSSAFLYFFLIKQAPNILPEFIANTSKELLNNKAQILKNGISEEAYNQAIDSLKNTNLQSIIMDDFVKKSFLGIIPSILISFYFKRRFIN
jgi:hypothetical protein